MTSRGISNFNPGNIDFNPAAFARDPWLGEIGLEDHTHPRFTTFETPEHGIRALCKILLTYHHRRKADDGSDIDTVAEVIDRWAPPVENDTDAYTAHVRKLLDVEKGEEIDIDDPEILAVLAKAIIHHENGEQPYDDARIERGVKMALG